MTSKRDWECTIQKEDQQNTCEESAWPQLVDYHTLIKPVLINTILMVNNTIEWMMKWREYLRNKSRSEVTVYEINTQAMDDYAESVQVE